MRMFMASLATETNSFAPFPTGRAAYEENGIGKGASRGTDGYGGGGLGVFRRRAEAEGIEVVESLTAFAQPAGPTVRRVYEELRDEILADLRAAMPCEMVLLLLHGAMIADGYDDCEGDILARARAIAPGAAIGLEIDPHCHLTRAMAEAADAIVIFKEYPHVDVADRAEELFTLCRRTALGEIRPAAALIDLRMVGFYPTFGPPMRDIVADLRAAEARPGVLSASIAHGVPWGDAADVGTRVIVYADGDAELAAREAAAIGERMYAEREALLPRYPGVAESLDRAAALSGRVVIGDYSDNPGGGAPCDSTFFLREMIARDLKDAAIGSFHDPAAARICADAGAGARLALRLGGKGGPASGDPLDIAAEVMAVREDHDQGVFGVRQKMGLAVWLRTGGIDVLVNTLRAQVYGTDLFTGLGLDLKSRRLIVVKSSRHYEAAFAPIADHLWAAVSPGALTLDFAGLPYTKRDGDYFPRVPDPWAVRGRPAPALFGPRPRT